jgi:hypothetical protein
VQQMPSRWFPAASRCGVHHCVEPLHVFSPFAVIHLRIPCCFTSGRHEQGEMMPPLATPIYVYIFSFALENLHWVTEPCRTLQSRC